MERHDTSPALWPAQEPGIATQLHRIPELLPQLEAIENADLIIAASPVYRASYTAFFRSAVAQVA